MNRIIEAARFAADAHEGQTRKWTNLPYVTHPANVAFGVMLLPNTTENMVCAAYLHDVVEDTYVTPEEISDRFGPTVELFVSFLTKPPKVEGKNRATRNAEYLSQLKTAPKEVKVIKMLDRFDNLLDFNHPKVDMGFRRLYIEESFDLVRAIGGADSTVADTLLELLAKLVQTSPRKTGRQGVWG